MTTYIGSLRCWHQIDKIQFRPLSGDRRVGHRLHLADLISGTGDSAMGGTTLPMSGAQQSWRRVTRDFLKAFHRYEASQAPQQAVALRTARHVGVEGGSPAR
jgi:hypothetical protein